MTEVQLGLGRRWRLADLSGVRAELRADRGFYMAIAVYVVVAIGMALALGRPGDLIIPVYVPIFLAGAMTVGLAAFTAVELPRAIREAPRSPMTQLLRAAPRRVTPRLVAGFLLFAAIAVFYGTFTSIKSMLPHATPFRFDAWAAQADAALHGGHDPWRLLQPLLGHHLVTRAIQALYLPGWMIMLFVFTAAIAMSRRLAPVRAQFFWTYLLLWPLVGNVLAGLMMSAGPAYYGFVTGDHHRYADLMAYLRFSAGLANSSYDLQHQLWTIYASGRAGLGSGISAFPSMHVAMATLYVLTAWRIDRRLAALTAVFAALILVGSVHLGWHYAIDGYASATVTVLVWSAVGRILRSRRQPTLRTNPVR